jgi:hypothetical protein
MCGAVKVEVEGEPIAMMVCHCNVCRSWSASPVNGATLFKPSQFKIIEGENFLNSFSLTEGHDRKWCNKCGGHVYVDHSTTYGKIDVYASILKDFEYKPTFHVNYESSILHIKDGLPKFKDFPEPLGGSGEMMDE